jgi:hypothetical protein
MGFARLARVKSAVRIRSGPQGKGPGHRVFSVVLDISSMTSASSIPNKFRDRPGIALLAFHSAPLHRPSQSRRGRSLVSGTGRRSADSTLPHDLASTAAGPADGTPPRRDRRQQRHRLPSGPCPRRTRRPASLHGDLRCALGLLLYMQPVACSKNGSADGAGKQRCRKDSHLRGAGEVRVGECQASDE